MASKLPKLPGYNTIRYKLTYSFGSLRHSITVHVVDGTTENTAINAAGQLATLLKPILATTTVFDSVMFAAKGSDVFNTVATLSVAGTGGAGAGGTQQAVQVVFTARSNTGRKTRISVFGTALSVPSNFRFTEAGVPAIGTIRQGLTAGTGNIVCIDASTPLWHSGATCGYNDHVAKLLRRT